jgi:hypothetical protein
MLARLLALYASEGVSLVTKIANENNCLRIQFSQRFRASIKWNPYHTDIVCCFV